MHSAVYDLTPEAPLTSSRDVALVDSVVGSLKQARERLDAILKLQGPRLHRPAGQIPIGQTEKDVALGVSCCYHKDVCPVPTRINSRNLEPHQPGDRDCSKTCTVPHRESWRTLASFIRVTTSLGGPR
jgi:hypothetical protein